MNLPMPRREEPLLWDTTFSATDNDDVLRLVGFGRWPCRGAELAMGDARGLSFGVREAVNFLGGCSEKTRFWALEVTEDAIPFVLEPGLSVVADDGRVRCWWSDK